MTPEERMEIVSVLSSLLGFTEGVTIMRHMDLGLSAEKARQRLEVIGEIQRAKALLRKVVGEE